MKTWLRTEDGWAVLLGLLLIALGLAPLAHADLLGWVVKTNVWSNPAAAMTPASPAFAALPGPVCLLLTYLFLLAILLPGAYAMGWNVPRFARAFTALFALSYFCYLLGNNAYVAATPETRAKSGVSWSLDLTNEAGYIVALLAGLFIGNFLPGVTNFFKEAARPEWFIKTAIVILGATLGVKAAGVSGKLVSAILFRGLAAIVEAYLIYWALVYFVARRFFRFSREWAVPLASGISVCGVSAAIATGAAIRARPVVPIMVSSLVVVFSVVELLVLPVAARTFLYKEPMVAAAWMGLAVKTDGAAISSGEITDGLIRGRAEADGVHYKEGLMQLTTTTVKAFIDLFIGVWALVLAVVWSYGIGRDEARGVPWAEIWARFPKFVLGYFVAFAALLAAGLLRPDLVRPGEPLKAGTDESDLFRGLFFVMTFFSIGLASNFRRLWAEGLAKLALVYVVCLFGFVVWIGLVISWLFFHGVVPPAAPGGA